MEIDDHLAEMLGETERLVAVFWKRARLFLIIKQFLSLLQITSTIAVLFFISYAGQQFVSSALCVVAILSHAVQMILAPDLKAEKYRILASDIMQQVRNIQLQLYIEPTNDSERVRTLQILQTIQQNINERLFELDSNLNLRNPRNVA